MKTLAVVLVILAILATGFAFVGFREAPETLTPPDDRLDGVMDRLEALEEGQRRLSRRLEERARDERPAAAPREISTDEIVARVKAEMEAGPKPDPAERTKDADPADAVNFRSLMAELESPGITYERRQAIWAELSKAGKLDDAIAFLEKQAKVERQNPEAQVDLGEAYIAKLQSGVAMQETATLSRKADAAYDRALELDDQHWRARFNKAVSLSFWPPVLGKQGEAIKHFEILLDQQSRGPARGGHASTHLFLGNMYLQTGNKEKALQTWQEGLAQFPDDEALKQQVANSGR